MDKLLEDESTAALIKQLNPSFTRPARPFKRLAYVDAIAWLNEHGIQREAEDTNGNVIKDANGEPTLVPHAIGDDIAEAAERKMTDILGTPVFLHSFPAELKAFYMKKKEATATAIAPGSGAGSGSGQPVLTESCDLLMPGVGEIVGGSMRIADIDELLAAYGREGIDPAPYYWFTDQRKYGTCEHGGYGLGVEVRVPSPTTRPRATESVRPSRTEFCLFVCLFCFARRAPILAFPGVAGEPVYNQGMLSVPEVCRTFFSFPHVCSISPTILLTTVRRVGGLDARPPKAVCIRSK